MRGARVVTVLLVAVLTLPAHAALPLGVGDVEDTAEEAIHQAQETVPSDPLADPTGDLEGEPWTTCRTVYRSGVGAALSTVGEQAQAEALDCREMCESARWFVKQQPGYQRVPDCDPFDGSSEPGPGDPDDVPSALPASSALPRIEGRTLHTHARDTDYDGAPSATIRSGPAPTPASPLDDASRLVLTLVTLAAVLLAPIVLHRRLSRDDLLDNDVRRAVLDAVQADPGRTAAEVARHVDVHYMTARYHLRLLCEFGEVDRRRLSGRIRFFPNHGRWGRRGKVLKDALASDKRRRIVTELLRDDELAAGDLSDRLDCARSTASFHLDRLVESGVIDRRRDGRHIRYRVRDDVRGRLLDLVTA